MKTFIFFVISLLFFLRLGLSQESRFKLGISVSPMYSWGLITNDGNTPQWLEDKYNESEIGKVSLSSSFTVEYRFNEKIQLGAGLGYQNNGQRTKKSVLFFIDNPNNPSGNPNPPIESRMVYNHHNLEIPIFMSYSILPRFYLVGGISPVINILNTSTSVLYYLEGEGDTERTVIEDNSTDFRRVNLFANLAIGFNLYEAKRIRSFVQAHCYFGVFGVSSNASLNRTPYATGVTFGVKF